jgi:hypothetical protein
MELDAFNNRLGLGQGRIPLLGSSDSDDQYTFILGEDEPGRWFELTPGDHAEVVQDTDLTGVDLIRASLKLRVPGSLSAGLFWEVSIIVDGIKLAHATPNSGRTRTLTDLAANVSKLAGTHQVGVRLELLEA